MAKQKRQTLIERERNKKGNGTISKTQLISCYLASTLIAVLCVVEALKPQTRADGDDVLYYVLAVLGVAFSVLITVKNKKAKKTADFKAPRLKP